MSVFPRLRDSTKGRAGCTSAYWSVVGRKRDIKHVNAVCHRYRHLLPGDLEFDYRIYLHECKESGDRGSNNGDYTHPELIEKLKEFLDLEELP